MTLSHILPWYSNDAHILLRQDCRKVWVLLECLELWTKLEEPQGFVICALLLGTTSDATPHVTMNFDWYTNTRSPECLCSLWENTGKTRLSFYYLLVSLLRQNCRKVWALLDCLELWTKLEEPQGFVICALLLGTSSDAIPHITMIFKWCTHIVETRL